MSIPKEKFNQIFKEYHKMVYSLCYQYLKDSEDSKDLMQECFVSLYFKYDKFDESKGSFENWFYVFCKNLALNELRKSKKKIPVELLEELPDVQVEELDLSLTKHEENLQEYIQHLPNGYKTVLELFTVHNWSHKMIAEHLNITESTSRSQYHKAKKFLNDLIQTKEV